MVGVQLALGVHSAHGARFNTQSVPRLDVAGHEEGEGVVDLTASREASHDTGCETWLPTRVCTRCATRCATGARGSHTGHGSELLRPAAPAITSCKTCAVS